MKKKLQNPPDPEVTGENLKALRLKMGLERDELGDKIGRSMSTIQFMEGGYRNTTVDPCVYYATKYLHMTSA